MSNIPPASVDPCDYENQIMELLGRIDQIGVLCISDQTLHQLHSFRRTVLQWRSECPRLQRQYPTEILRRLGVLLQRVHVHEAGAPCPYARAGATTTVFSLGQQ